MLIHKITDTNYFLSKRFFFVIIRRLGRVFNKFDSLMDEEDLQIRLSELRREHKDLDDVIERLHEVQPVDLFQIQRLKKRKLLLKDMIQKIESDLVPDIIA